MRMIAIVPVTLLAMSAALGSNGHDGLNVKAGGPVDDCWLCDDETCYNTTHVDQLPGLEEGRWMGGTFVNMCGYAYSECWEFHDPCSPTDDSDALAFAVEHVDELQRLLAAGNAAGLKVALARFDGFARFDPAEGAIHVTSCDGQLFARLIPGQAALAVLSTS